MVSDFRRGHLEVSWRSPSEGHHISSSPSSITVNKKHCGHGAVAIITVATGDWPSYSCSVSHRRHPKVNRRRHTSSSGRTVAESEWGGSGFNSFLLTNWRNLHHCFYDFRSSRQDLRWIWRDRGSVLIVCEQLEKSVGSYRCWASCWSVWFDLQMLELLCGQARWLSWLWDCSSWRSSSLTPWWQLTPLSSGKRMSQCVLFGLKSHPWEKWPGLQSPSLEVKQHNNVFYLTCFKYHDVFQLTDVWRWPDVPCELERKAYPERGTLCCLKSEHWGFLHLDKQNWPPWPLWLCFITMILYWVLNSNLVDWMGECSLSGSQEEQVWKASSFVAPISASFLLTSQVLQTLAVEGRLCLWGQTRYLIRT